MASRKRALIIGLGKLSPEVKQQLLDILRNG